VLSRDRDVVEKDVAVGGAADGRPLALRDEVLAGTLERALLEPGDDAAAT